MEATPGNSRDPAGSSPPLLEESNMNTEIHVAYDTDFDMTDESDDSVFCLETDKSEEITSDDDISSCCWAFLISGLHCTF